MSYYIPLGHEEIYRKGFATMSPAAYPLWKNVALIVKLV